MILIIDNYDSFTFNLVQYLGEIKDDIKVIRNDEMPAAEALALGPTHIVVSPGPCTPVEAGISMEIIRTVPATVPLLGVCLGHQAIGAAFGGKVARAAAPMHGKTARIRHDGEGIFRNIPSPFTATRYHSLIVEREGLPAELHVTATCTDEAAAAAGGSGELIMGLRHARKPIFGLQFHPESILTEHGKVLIRNFLEYERIV